MKFNWRSKKFIGGIIAALCIGFGVAPDVFAPAATNAACAAVKCDA